MGSAAGEKSFTESTKCGHCQNVVTMEIVARHSTVQQEEDERSPFTWEAGFLFELIKCPACREIMLRRLHWDDRYMDGSDQDYETLYPAGDKMPRGLPPKIKKGYEAAQRVRNVDPNAYGVLLGRVLEMVCGDRNASGDTLEQRLQCLSTRGDIPTKLVAVATGLRKLRNVGAHPDLGELTGAELPVLDDLTRAILEYVYSAPSLAKEAEDRLGKLKAQRPRKAAKATTGEKASVKMERES